MPAPTVVNVGAVASGTTISPPYPASILQNDILVGIAESAGNTGYTPPAGWAHVPGSPINVDTQTRLTVLWHRQGNGSASGDVTASWGAAINHAVGRVIAIRGCPTTGNPWDATPQTGSDTGAGTTALWPSVVTTIADCLILFCIATGRDFASTANMGSPTGGTGLTLMAERMDNWISTGTGGGIGMLTAVKAAVGSTGSPSSIMGDNAQKALMTLALAPLSTGTNYTATPADNAGATDSARLDRGEAAADTAGGLDAPVLVWAYVTGPTDTASASDTPNINLQTNTTTGVTDSAGAVDSPLTVQILARAFADVAAGGDSVSAAATYVVVASDTADALDTQAPQRITLTELPASSAGAADLAVSDLTAGQPEANPADSAGAADSAAYLADLVRVVGDPAGASDSAQADLSGVLTRTPADTAAGFDETTALSQGERTAADPAAGSDAAQVAQDRSLADGAGATDAPGFTQAQVVTLADPAGASDSASPVLSGAGEQTASDTAGAADVVAAVLQGQRAAADVAAGSDAIVVERSTLAADSGSATDAVTVQRGEAVDDSAGGSDAPVAVQANVRGVGDSAGMTDGATPEFSGVAAQTLNDAAAAADDVSAAMNRVVTPADLLGLIDNAARVSDLGQVVADAASGADAASQVAARFYTVADLAEATDTTGPTRFVFRTSTGTTPRVLAGVTYRP